MNHLKKIFLSVLAFFVLLSAIFLYVEIKTNRALKDYSMLPDAQKVVDKSVLGREPTNILIRLLYRLKPGVLELICTNKGNIYLLMKDDVRYTSIYDGATLYTNFRMENGVKKGRAEIAEMDWVSSGYFDTMLSRPLSEKEITSIIRALIEGNNFNGISLSLKESAYGFANRAKLSNVTRLINQCKSTQ